MGFPVKEVGGDGPHGLLDVGIGDLLSGGHETGDFQSDDLGGLLLESPLVGRDESLAFDDGGGDKAIALGIDDQIDADHALGDEHRTVAEDRRRDGDGGLAVDVDGIGRDLAAGEDLMVEKGQDVAVLADEGVVLVHAAFHGDVGVELQHSVFSVDRHEIARPCKLLEQTHLLSGGVSGSVEVCQDGIGDDDGAKTGQLIDDAVDGSRVSGNDGRGEDDRVAGKDMDVPVVPSCDAGKDRHRLALRSGAEDADLVGGKVLEILGIRQGLIGDFDIAIFPCRLDIGLHGTSEDDDLPLEADRRLDDLLDTGDIGREGGDDKTAGGLGEDIGNALDDRPLGRGVSLLFRIGGIGHEKIDPLIAEAGELGEIEVGIDRGQVDLEIARLDDRPLRGRDEQAEGIRDRMGDVIEFDLEVAGLDDGVLVVLEKLRIGADARFLQLVPDERTGDLRRIDDRHVDSLEKEGDAADVVFVTMGDDKSLDLGGILFEMGEVRDDVVDSRHAVLREHDTAIDDEDRIVVLDAVEVLSDLAQSAQSINLHGRAQQTFGFSHKRYLLISKDSIKFFFIKKLKL